MQVSIIIVNYNTVELLRNCLASIYQHTNDMQFEIIVSDNGSVDGSLDMIKTVFPDVILVENNNNLGFGAANNRGLDAAKGKYIFYLNSDTILLNNAVKIFFDYWETCDNPENLGALGCNLLNENHEVTNSWGPFFSFKNDVKTFINDYIHLILTTAGYVSARKQYPAKKHLGEVDVIVGAALFLLNNQDARFDEYFFLYHEEMDLELQLSRKNKKRVLIEGPVIVHLEGRSNQVNASNDKYADFCSFSRIHDGLSRIKYNKKNKDNPVGLFLLKLLLFLNWTYPPVIKKTHVYWKDLWRI
ncbi:glycosyl transferase [Spirochaetia bacterium]|nr:glycosyl transferase [Spirochaetia bacterium]